MVTPEKGIIILHQESKRKGMDIALALGGGGSRGYAHIGVLRRLEQGGYHVQVVAGTSAGGIMAALYAAGYTPDEMEAVFIDLDQSKLFGRTFKDGPGLLGLSTAEKVLEGLLGDLRFEDLKLPCAMIAVDLQTGQEVVLNHGRVVDAIMATIAVPGVFPPKDYKDTQLVDGAVLNPVPVSVARWLAPNLPVVAVVLDATARPNYVFPNIPLPVQVPIPIVKRLTRTRVAQAFGIFLRSVDISSRKMAELRLLADDPEVIISPNVGGVGLLDKVDVPKIVRLGEEAADAGLPDLRRAVAWPNRLRRMVFPKLP
jgi:NTE family protein